MPAEPGGHLVVRLEGQGRVEATRLQRDLMGDPAGERPARTEIDCQRRPVQAVRQDAPRAVEYRPVDGVRRQVALQLVDAAGEREAPVADPARERDHRVAAPPDRPGTLRDEDLVAPDIQRGETRSDAGVDRQRVRAGAQDQRGVALGR